MQETTTLQPARRNSLAARLAPLAGFLLPAWLRRTFVWGFWIGYFGFAALVLVLRYSVLPNIESYRGDIERAISRAAGVNVTIASIDTDWRGLRPQLSLHGFKVHDAAGRLALSFDEVDTELAWSSLLHRQLRLHQLEIDAPALDVRREKNGSIFIAGVQLNTAASGTVFSDWLLAQDRIVVRNATIRWEDALRGAPPLTLERLDFVLENHGRRHRFGLTAEPPRELAARLDVRGDFRGEDLGRLEEWKGEAYAELDYADLAVWRAWVDYPLELPQGTGAIRLWLGFADRKLNSATADLAVRDVRLRLGSELPMLDLAHLSGRLSGRLHQAGFEFGGKKLNLATRDGISIPETDFSLRWTPPIGKRPAHGELAANSVDLDAVARLAGFLPLDAGTRQKLADYAPRGRLEELKLGWSGEADAPAGFNLRARFDGLGAHAQGRLPGFAGLSGSIEGSEKAGLVSLQSRNAALDLPTVFAVPRLDFEQFAAQANWAQADGRVELQLHSLSFENRDAAGSASGRYRSSADGPGEIDLTARLSRGEGTAVWRYMPLAVNKDVPDWLRASITGGRADDARLRLKGDLKDFPFAGGKGGTFRVSAKFKDAGLRYAEGWPRIDNIAGELLFEGKRMLIRAERAFIYGVRLSGVTAEIADLLTPQEIVAIAGRADGPTNDFLRFIDTSPVAAKIEHFTEGMRAVGNGSLGLKLTLNLRQLQEARVDGDYLFAKNQVVVDSDLPPLTDVNGRLHFDEGGVAVKDLRAVLLGAPVSINASTLGDGTVAIGASGSMSIANLRSGMDHRLFDHLSGSTSWRGTILVRKRNAEVALESNLQGIASSLPEPFNKTAGESMPLVFQRGAAAGATPPREIVRASLGRVLNAQFVRRREAGKVTVERAAIGIGEAPALPEKGVLLAVNVKSLDADFWRELFAGEGGGAPSVTALNLRAGELSAVGRQFGEVALNASLQDATWHAQLASKEASGDVTWKAQGQGRLRARLKQLVLNESRSGKTSTVEEPLRELPGLDIVADSFTLRGKKLGRLELQATNDASVWRIEKLAIATPDGAFNADGAWKSSGTELNFKLDVSDIGGMLDRLGYADAVKRGTAKLEGRISWKGAPTQIDYPSLDGSIDVEATRGQFNKLEPGIGKLLGILSLQALPRRITLDFRDVFSEGFAFDSFRGHAKVARGIMTTQDLQIRGPSAKILMTGDVSLPAETQNLRVRVQPALSEGVAVGAMLANPALGVAAWLAQKVLRDPLDQIFAYEYAVTGSWSDPKVEKIQQPVPRREEQGP